jgi:hypothetical protein
MKITSVEEVKKLLKGIGATDKEIERNIEIIGNLASPTYEGKKLMNNLGIEYGG